MAQEGDIREEHQRVTQECTPESPLFRPREDSESYQRSFREHVRAIFPNKGFPKFPWNPCFCCWQPPSVRCLLMPPSVLHITFLSLSLSHNQCNSFFTLSQKYTHKCTITHKCTSTDSHKCACHITSLSHNQCNRSLFVTQVLQRLQSAGGQCPLSETAAGLLLHNNSCHLSTLLTTTLHLIRQLGLSYSWTMIILLKLFWYS